MTIAEELMRDLAGQIPGLDDPSVLEAFLGDRDPTNLIYDVLVDQGDDFREALEAFCTPHEATLVVHDRHPCLQQIIAWAQGRPGGELLLLASPHGPPIPAVLVLEHRR